MTHDHVRTTPGVERLIDLYLVYWGNFAHFYFPEDVAEALKGQVAVRLPKGYRAKDVNKAWYSFLVGHSVGLHSPAFHSDAQCTRIPDFVHRRYCIFHDFLYWRGGLLQDQIDADLFLGVCSDHRAELAKTRLGHWLLHAWGRVLSGGTVAFGRSHFVERILP